VPTQNYDIGGRTVEDVGRSTARTLSSAASSVRDGFNSSVEYFRTHDAKQMASDAGAYLKSHPTQALVGAAVLGFFAGRMIRRS
jgi:hypothetical protein